MKTMDLNTVSDVKQEEKHSPQKFSSSSNGFTARYVDLNLANRVYKSFPQMPVNGVVSIILCKPLGVPPEEHFLNLLSGF